MKNKTKYKIIFLLLWLSGFAQLKAQDVNATVQVVGPSLQLTDKEILTKLQQSIQQFIISTKWVDETIINNERLEFSLFFDVKSIVNTSDFSCNLQISVSRPVLNSTYKSQTFTFNDEEVYFRYSDLENLSYQEGQNVNDLTTYLAFYTYLALGYDDDSYSKLGGDNYFKKAQNIVNIMQGKPGWKQSDGRGGRNRYNLVDNLTNTRYKTAREVVYNYHRLGMDNMYDNAVEARKTVTTALKGFEDLNKLMPNNLLQKTFFSSKWAEIVEIYKDASATEKKEILELLAKLDPSNMNRYEKIKT